MKFNAYNEKSFRQSQYYKRLPTEELKYFDVLTKVFHFKANNYVLDHLIDWEAIPDDPMYRLIFPRKEMLNGRDHMLVRAMDEVGLDQRTQRDWIKQMKKSMRPQVKIHQNVPLKLNGESVPGTCSDFRTIISLFPAPMVATCHSYCTYCFRWVLFNDPEIQRHGSYQDPYTPVPYLRAHPEIKDALFTGADPMVLGVNKLKEYIEPILEVDSIEVIRISTKSLAWWPYRFTTDKDADEVLKLFEYVQSRGKHMNLNAHFTHPRELDNPAVQEAIQRIRATGTMIRCQGPLIKDINDDPKVWSEMWTKQIQLGLVPYYMFVEANHHTENCFRIPMAEALRIFQEAQKYTTGLARTVRGPVFMNNMNRVLLDGTTSLNGGKYFVLKCLQGPPGTDGEGKIKLIPYDEDTKDFGDLFALFQEEEKAMVAD